MILEKRLQYQLYGFGILYPLFAVYSFIGQDIADVYYQYLVYDKTSTAIVFVQVISIIIEFGLVFFLHIAIQQRSLDKFKIFWVSHAILFILLNCLYAMKFARNAFTTSHISIDIIYFIWFWTFTLQGPTCFQLRDFLRREKGFPITGKMFGIGIRKLLFAQVVFQWIFFPNTLYLHYALVKDAPEEMLTLLQPGEIGMVISWTIRTVTLGLAAASILLYFGIRKKSISIIKCYYVLKILLFIILSGCTFTSDVVLRAYVPKLILNSSSSFIYRTCLRMIFILELCELKYFIHLLRIRKQFPTEQIESYEIPQNWNKDLKSIIDRVRISNWRVQYDTTMEFNKIGEGTFGNVYKGSLRKGFIGLRSVPVAIKVLKFNKDNDGYIESLISEMKSLLVTQNHPNLVKTYGIIWKKKSKGIIMEYCSFGSLDHHLIALRKDKGFPGNITKAQLNELQTWAIQIASAMEFVGNKHIIHADLSIRNVLLDSNRNTKITDFGMSLRLYNYQIYAKSNSSVLPWRWMSPESLTDLRFSTMSDVWSYGVLLFELYTFGQTPWYEMAWSSDFVHQLNDGLLLPKPPLASEYLYNCIMKRCWHLDAKLRIGFKDILRNFQILSTGSKLDYV